MDSLENKLQVAKKADSLDSLNPAEKKLYQDFVVEGYNITRAGTPIDMDTLMKVTGRNRQGVHSLFNALGKKDIHVERVKGEKPEKGKAPTLYKIKLNLIQYLLKTK